MISEFSLWTALITPMKPDGNVDFNDLEKLVRLQEKAGNGILILGSTGEGLALTDDEKKEVVEFVSGLNVDVPIMAGVGGFNLDKQSEWITYCNQLNIDAFLLVAPLYAKPGPEGQKAWFKTLMEISKKPCMVYNIPGRTGVKIPPQVLKGLNGHKNFWSVKEASGSIEDYQQFREAVPDIPLYSGDDGLLPFFAAAGCGGLVSVASNVWPEATNLYVKKCLSGETENLFPLWKNAVNSLFSASNPIPVKKLLAEKGIIKSATLRPPLTVKELDSVEHLVKVDKKISTWFKNNR